MTINVTVSIKITCEMDDDDVLLDFAIEQAQGIERSIKGLDFRFTDIEQTPCNMHRVYEKEYK